MPIVLGYAIVISRRKNLRNIQELLLVNEEHVERSGVLVEPLKGAKGSLEKRLHDLTLEVVEAKVEIEDKERDCRPAI